MRSTSRRSVRPGDVVTWGQACRADRPRLAPMARCAGIGDFTAFIGITWSEAIAPEHADWSASSPIAALAPIGG